MFSGKHYHRVDEKGRIALPAKFRAEFAQGVVIVPGADKCLNVYPFPLWEKTSAMMSKNPVVRSKMRRLGRFLFGEATMAELDTQGRIPLPQDWRQSLNLKEEVVIVGVNKYLEIWGKDAWEKESAELSQEAWQIFESVEDNTSLDSGLNISDSDKS